MFNYVLLLDYANKATTSLKERQRISRCDEEMGNERSTCFSWPDQNTQKNGSNWWRRGKFLYFDLPKFNFLPYSILLSFFIAGIYRL